MQEKYADSIAIILVFVLFANALLTTLGLSGKHVAWFCFSFAFISVLAIRLDNSRRGRKKGKR